MRLMTAKDWAQRGYRIRTGARSIARGAGGVALFSQNQVTPWDYIPAGFRVPNDVIVVDGQMYRRV